MNKDVLAQATGYISVVEKGEKGAIERPRKWEDIPSVDTLQCGAPGEAYIDIVLYNDSWYQCVKSHTKGDGVYPTNTEYYKSITDYQRLATNLFLANRAYVNNLVVNDVLIKDSAGNTTLSANKDGIECNQGTFKNVNVTGEVNATSGKIAGLSVLGNSLTNAGFNNDAYIILRNDDANAFAGIGANILPSETSMRSIARFANEDASTKNIFGTGRNIAMLLSAKNSDYNMAFGGSGCGFLDGYISGYGFEEMTLNEKNTCHIIHPKKSLMIISNQTEQTASIGLPKLSSIRTLLGIGNSEKFAIPIEIILTGNRYGFIYGRNTYINDMNTSVYPSVDYNQEKKVQYHTGTAYVDRYFKNGYNKFILIYDGSNYYAVTVQTTLYYSENNYDI